MTRTRSRYLALIAVLLSPMAANADFVGDYAVGNWTETIDCANDIAGGVDTSGAPSSITLIECDSSFDLSVDTLYFEIQAIADSIFQFDWVWGGVDLGFAEGGYLLDGVFTFLASSFFDSGTESVLVSAGQTFGWYNTTYDNCCGSTTLTISNFNVTQVPEPGTLALLGIGLFGIGLSRRRRTA